MNWHCRFEVRHQVTDATGLAVEFIDEFPFIALPKVIGKMIDSDPRWARAQLTAKKLTMRPVGFVPGTWWWA